MDYDEQGERFKEWRKVVNEMREYSFGGWPLEGPPSTMHLAKHMLRNGGDPRLWLQVWSRHKGVVETDRVMFELRTLIEIFYLGGVYVISSTWHPLHLLRQLLGGFKALWMHIPHGRPESFQDIVDQAMLSPQP